MDRFKDAPVDGWEFVMAMYGRLRATREMRCLSPLVYALVWFRSPLV